MKKFKLKLKNETHKENLKNAVINRVLWVFDENTKDTIVTTDKVVYDFLNEIYNEYKTDNYRTDIEEISTKYILNESEKNNIEEMLTNIIDLLNQKKNNLN